MTVITPLAQALPSCPLVLIFAAKLGIVIPLAVVCLSVIVLIPLGARRGKLSIPACVYMALGAAALALGAGKLAGISRVRGTAAGVAVSVLFFLLVATAVGSFIGLYFFRDTPKT
jgi:hypothetical protein